MMSTNSATGSTISHNILRGESFMARSSVQSSDAAVY